MNPASVVFVGQGPNRAAWARGLACGARTLSMRSARVTVTLPFEALGSGPVEKATRRTTADEWAERNCSLIALTGAAGEKIGGLIGLDVGTFHRTYQRRNLNARFGGKVGKGDAFDYVEGRRRAAEIRAEDFTRFVLVGAAVAECFGLRRAEPLTVKGPTREDPRRYFLLPHPSGIVLWWNEPFNVFRARKRLREFLEIPNQ